MDMAVFLQAGAVPPALIPVFIFLARVIDVSLGTLRILIVARGMRWFASLLGFLEVFIWLLAISQVLQNLHGLINYITYSAGFAAGTFVGMTLERRLTLGSALVRIIVPRGDDNTHLFERLVNLGYRVTHVAGEGARGPVDVIFSVVRRKSMARFMETVKAAKPDAFYSVEDVRQVSDIDNMNAPNLRQRGLLQPFYWFRKSK